MPETIFWVSLAFISYVYFGYPLLLRLWSWTFPRRVNKGKYEPSVSLIIAAHNERETIARKLVNCLELEYPREKLQILVSLDGPSDGTENIVWRYAARGIDVVYCSDHKGKAAAINRAVEEAGGEVLVFADARQRLDVLAIRELVANFRDPAIGVVSGALILQDDRGRESSDGVGIYWRYEKWLRSQESRIHSILGATGAIYAIRRALFQPIPEGTILDDVAIPMQAVLCGWRSVYDPAARAYDRVSESAEEEYQRKVRTLTGNYQLIAGMPRLLVPWRNPVFLQFVSHKVGRLLVPYFLISLFISNIFLLHGFYAAVFSVQAVWYVLAFAGAPAPKPAVERSYEVEGDVKAA